MKIDFLKIDGVRCGFVDITPKMAEEMLLRNTDNYRKIDPKRVEGYAREMANGLWRVNGEPICFNEKYILTNGQHRLNAVVKSGKTIRTMVIIGLDENLFDQGRVRTIGQLVKGYDNSTIGAVRVLMKKKNSVTFTGAAETQAMMDKYGESMLAIKRTVCKGTNHPILKTGPCIAAAWCSCVLNYITPAQLSVFCEVVNSGLPADGIRCGAALLCRKTLQEIIKTVGGDALQVARFEIVVQAIIDFTKKKEPKRKYQPNNTMTSIIKYALDTAELLGKVHFDV